MMASPPNPINYGKKRKVININLNEKVNENWPKFIVISSEDKSVTKISPFALNKTLIATAGTLKM